MQNQETSTPSHLRLVGILAAIGVAIVGAGELMLHWTGHFAVPGESLTDYDFMFGISRERLVAGHFIGVLFGPVYFLGYWQVSERLRPLAPLARRVFFGIALYTLTVGIVWIGSRAFLARSLQLAADDAARVVLADEYSLLLETLIWALRVGMLLLSGLFIFWVARRKTTYPAWMAIFNPFTLLLLVFSTLFIPSVGPQLVPAALNVAHVPFFLLSALVPAVHRLPVSKATDA